eukprot:scaffold32342_cov75-Skeletonema_marinoi.AAC.2
MASFGRLLLLLFIAAGLLCEEHADCYSVVPHRRKIFSRRAALAQIGAAFATFSLPANAKEDGDISLVTDATDALSSLIENWERAT